MRGADREPRPAAIDQGKIDQLVERLFERCGRIVAGTFGAQRIAVTSVRQGILLSTWNLNGV